jgi:hypothetical protein
MPESPSLSSVVPSTARDQAPTATAPSPTSVRSRGAAAASVEVALAQPPAAKKTGMGAATATNAQPGCRASRLAPRTSP